MARLTFAQLLLLSPALSYAAVLPRSPKFETEFLKAFAAATPHTVTDNYLNLARSSKPSRSFARLSELQDTPYTNDRYRLDVDDTSPSNALISALGGAEYLTEIVFGEQKVDVILDTGSSDTWLIQQGFKCTDSTGAVQPSTTCSFGGTYNGTFGNDKIPNVNFNISYGDGEFVTGDMGYKDITIAGITVPHQEVALGTSAYWNGDKVSTGLLGLAYSAITSAYNGTDPSQDTTHVSYDPIFSTMVKQGLSAPSFSLAIQRGSGGYIAFGGLPPVTFSDDFAVAPIQQTTLRTGTVLAFYAMTPDAIVYDGAPATNTDQYIVDSGTTLAYVPAAVSKSIADLFTPKAQLLANQGGYFVDCKAKAPAFGIKVGGKILQVNALDMIMQGSVDATTGLCLVGVQSGGSSGPYILGDTFLQSVVAVFDVGAGEMRFAEHTY